MDMLFENEFNKLTSEYKQLNESLMKGIANNFKHATGKGMGEEVKKTFDAFCKDYHFTESKKNPGIFVKKSGNFTIGIKLDFVDNKQASTGKVLLTVINNKKNKKELSDEAIAIKHSHTLEELYKNIMAKLSPLKIELSKTDISDEDSSSENNNKGDDKKDKKSSLDRKVVRALEDRFAANGFSEDELDSAVDSFESMWSKMDEKQRKVIAALVK